jgi:DNA-binding response OmpR family regulator
MGGHMTENKPLILAVDRNSRNLELLVQFLEREGFQTITANSLENFTLILAELRPIQIGLIDISGFNCQIWTHCEQLREQNIPFLVLLPKQSAAIQQESLVHGAQSILIKPLVIKQLLGLIRSLLEAQA